MQKLRFILSSRVSRSFIRSRVGATLRANFRSNFCRTRASSVWISFAKHASPCVLIVLVRNFRIGERTWRWTGDPVGRLVRDRGSYEKSQNFSLPSPTPTLPSRPKEKKRNKKKISELNRETLELTILCRAALSLTFKESLSNIWLITKKKK